MKTLCIIISIVMISILNGQPLKIVNPESVKMNSQRLQNIDIITQKYIEKSYFPGGIVLVAKDGAIVYKKAFGNKAEYPTIEKNDVNTIYDLASVSKPVATGTCIMLLVEKGTINLNNTVDMYLKNFKPFKDSSGKEYYPTIYHLLTHTSGFPAYLSPSTFVDKYTNITRDDVLNEIFSVTKNNKPGERFVYSCLGFITLAEIVHKVSGKTIDIFFEEEVAKPLGLKNTFFLPQNTEGLAKREVRLKDIAPTEKQSDGSVFRGVVHDPLAHTQQGISGNAGLFSNADDLAIFCQMMLNGGEYNGKRILGRKTIEAMTRPYKKVPFANRGLSWDVNSAYMSQNGNLFIDDSYGHTGYTGTSIVVVPNEKLFLIILTNRVHPDDDKNILEYRAEIANIVASALE